MDIAIIKTGGKQYLVTPGQKVKIEKLGGQVGEAVSFDEVLLTADKGKVQIGQPRVAGLKISGKIIAQERDDKITIFKYKAKKRYKVKRGHRQPHSIVEIAS
ncbi:MAG: 50S ribosomal protein L21 [Patescibacteria group bacterium]